MRKPLLIGTIALGVLMIAAGVIWLTSPQGAASSLSGVTTSHADGVPRITPAVLNSLLQGEDAPLVWEIRAPETYAAQHVPGSRLMTLDGIAGAAAGLDKSQAIITLCTWPDESTSARAARTLQTLGFNNVAALLGGWNAWVAAGLPTEGSAQ